MSQATGKSSGRPSSADRGLQLVGTLALAGVAALSWLACWRRIWAIDFWWQLRAGRWVAEHGWPTVDTLSYTAGGAPWIELRWLFCAVQFRLFEGLGPASLVLLKWLLVLVAFAGVTTPVLRARNRIVTAAVLTLALLAATQRFYLRPELVTYALFGVFVCVLDHHRRTASRWVWVLPALEILWVNSHPLFLFGPLLVGLMLFVHVFEVLRPGGGSVAAEARRRLPVLSGVLAATVAACWINPYGVRGLALPWLLFSEMRGSVFRDTIVELQSPFVFGSAYLAVGYYQVLLGVALLSALGNWRRLDPFWTLLCASQLYLSVLSIRNLALFSLAAVPFVLANLDRASWPSRLPPRLRAAGLHVLAAAVVIAAGSYGLQMVTDRFSLHQHDSNQFGSGIADHRYPIRAMDFLERQDFDGRVFGGLLEGSYLTHRGWPVFIDPRLEIYGEPVFRRFLLAQRSREAWDREVRELDIRAALIEPSSPLVALLTHHPDWQPVYFDEVSALFLRSDAAPGVERLLDSADFATRSERVRERLPPPQAPGELGPLRRVALPKPFLNVADFLLVSRQERLAAPWLDDVERLAPRIGGLAHRRAVLAEGLGDAPGVIAAASAALEQTPDDVAMQIRLGEACFREERWSEARSWLTRSLEARPERALTWYVLGRAAWAEADTAAAERAFRRATELEPDDLVYQRNLARLLARAERWDEAVTVYGAAVRLAPDDPGLLAELARALVAAGRPNEARPVVARGLRLAPGDARLVELARGLGLFP